MFTSKTNVRYLALCEHWFADGTFKTVPKLFKQLYSIHGLFKGKIVPLVFFLMTKMDEEGYRKSFTALKTYAEDLNIVLQSRSIMTDFEVAAAKAFLSTFPGIENRGCFFAQCLWRRTQKDSQLLDRYLFILKKNNSHISKSTEWRNKPMRNERNEMNRNEGNFRISI